MRYVSMTIQMNCSAIFVTKLFFTEINRHELVGIHKSYMHFITNAQLVEIISLVFEGKVI